MAGRPDELIARSINQLKGVGMREPLKGSTPDYPAYWANGGARVQPGDVPPQNNVFVPARVDVDAEVHEAQAELGRAVLRYAELLDGGEAALTAGDAVRPGGYPALAVALASWYGQVSYFSGRLCTLRRMASTRPRQRGLFEGRRTETP